MNAESAEKYGTASAWCGKRAGNPDNNGGTITVKSHMCYRSGLYRITCGIFLRLTHASGVGATRYGAYGKWQPYVLFGERLAS
jgi:hypothetical protein